MQSNAPNHLAGLFAGLLLLSMSSHAANELPSGFDCIINPSQTVDLGSPVSGQITEVLVDRSNRVSAGQVVARLDSRLEQANLIIANFKAGSGKELGLHQAALEIDQRTLRRLNSLEASKAASAQDKDKAQRDARLSNWRLRIAEDDMRLKELEQGRALTLLDLRSIRSPIEGVVVARLLDPGEYVDEQALLRIAQLDPLHIEAILPIRLFGKIKPGMRARVSSEYAAIESLNATVDLVDPIGDAASATFGVRLKLPNPDQTIPAGLKCRVEISLENAIGESSAATAAVNPRLTPYADNRQH